jgi:GNAT superfamily N-acetyltransferase
MVILARELRVSEFGEAEKIWLNYHQQKADPAADRIFAIFADGTLAGVARCKLHTDGDELDGVYVLEQFRGQGLARRLVEELITACGGKILYLHSTLELIQFYRSFGFVPIPENDLPHTIKERFAMCFGEMMGCNVCPMRRIPLVAKSSH